ncbi:PD-(D/E)XK nuclease family protein [Algoriphagus formosus]|uniref:PD-(D/E)XK nuclease family protein n=1 Tax=Algoriphagus formosus TaxID=2007308 RepID=UPI000C2871C7|nr:PD-(D/E)XK nuclease family protein [Algoriphagus formosus]
MKPNIFDISTKELSQDAFLTWLLMWADEKNKDYDFELNKCGTDFITQMIKKKYSNFNEKIKTVSVNRQWNNIDVLAKVNSKYLIIIEDKTNTEKHSGQLPKYKQLAEAWCKKQTPLYFPPICIYLKTGNESLNSLKSVVKDGFEIFKRQDLLTLINNYSIKNEIFNDFKERLSRIEEANNDWEEKLIQDWNGSDWQGFYQYLEKQIDLIDWKYVNNPNGGFWNAVINWSYWGNYPAYLQTEQYKLCFKLSTDPAEDSMFANVNRKEVRNELSELILKSAREKNISSIKRPNRYGNGKYMTVAIVEGENWLGKNDELINKEKVLENLMFYKSFLLSVII